MDSCGKLLVCFFTFSTSALFTPTHFIFQIADIFMLPVAPEFKLGV